MNRMSANQQERERLRAMVALVHLQEAIRNGAVWDESHYSAACELAGFIGGNRG